MGSGVLDFIPRVGAAASADRHWQLLVMPVLCQCVMSITQAVVASPGVGVIVVSIAVADVQR